MSKQHKLVKLFDAKLLAHVCSLSVNGFKEFATMHGEGDERYFFKDNGAKILGIAHLDSVCEHGWATMVTTPIDTIIHSPVLDDRLGAYVIMGLLPAMGIKVDWLLTIGEESGKSTAQFFEPPKDKEYNWMFSFDREGTDMVMYDYETPQLRKLMESYKFNVRHGSTSDIRKLEDLGCAGFNFGTGYYNYHSMYAWASQRDLLHNVWRFARFYHDHKCNKFAYTRPEWKNYLDQKADAVMPYGGSFFEGGSCYGQEGNVYRHNGHSHYRGRSYGAPVQIWDKTRERFVDDPRYTPMVPASADPRAVVIARASNMLDVVCLMCRQPSWYDTADPDENYCHNCGSLLVQWGE